MIVALSICPSGCRYVRGRIGGQAAYTQKCHNCGATMVQREVEVKRP